MERRRPQRRTIPASLPHRPTKAGLLWSMLLCLTVGGFGGAAVQRSMTPSATPREVLKPVPERKAADDKPPVAPAPAAVDAAVAPHVFNRDTERSNLFVVPVEGHAQGAKVDFAIDTGAEITILRNRDAKAMDAVTDDIHDRDVIVIGSVMQLKGATVPRMRVAGVEFTDVEVLIGPDTLPFSLLGQKEIARLGSVEFDGDVMRVSPSRIEESMD